MSNTLDELCLKWDGFQESTSNAFANLRVNVEFADVTLACEDGQQVEAHKVILATSSPFFKKLLERNKHPHPLIYMRGMKSNNRYSWADEILLDSLLESSNSRRDFDENH